MKRITTVSKSNEDTLKLEKAVKSLNETTKLMGDKPANHRYNIEIPLDLYQQIQEHIGKSGQNLKGFFIASAKFYLKNKQAE